MKYKQKHYPVHNCLNCGEAIYSGRVDKKFCTISCKNEYHNNIRSKKNEALSDIRDSLKKNYQVLNKVVSAQKDSVTLAEARSAGFNSRLYTFRLLSLFGNKTYRCYDLEYSLNSRKIFNIHRC